jgi:hypothetical protein
MRGHSLVKHAALLVLFSLVLSLAFFAGCEKTKTVTETRTVRDTITIRDTVALQIISVDEVYANPDSIAQGGSVMLTADVSHSQPLEGSLTYSWFADGGTFDATDADTVTWMAPGDVGSYTISVHVTDGVHIGIGVRRIGVGMYAPTVTPYYVGGPSCACHEAANGLVSKWEQTGHAVAWETLQGSGHVSSSCIPCHTVGYFVGYDLVPNSGNSGYDEAPIEKFENVQCEDCHSPASEHIATDGTAPMVVDYNAMNCGKCHEGTHHPYYSEWQQSLHGQALENHGASVTSCQGCHEGVGAATRLSGDLSTFYGSGSVGRPDTSEFALEPIVCQACHSSHSAANPGQMRTVANVVLVEANGQQPTVSDGGVGKLCMHCHHARHSAEEQLEFGDAHFGPHPSTQGDMLSGNSGYEGVASAGFVWGRAIHLYIENSCKTCHLQTQEYGSEQNPAVTGHLFVPTVEACAYCHGTITDFEEIPASGDFDGDGTVEGLQVEVEGLIELLTEALVADGLDTVGTDVAGALGDTAKSTYTQREAGYNLVFVEDDGSMGVHNPRYAVKLLQQSYEFLTGNPPANAAILRDEEPAVAKW